MKRAMLMLMILSFTVSFGTTTFADDPIEATICNIQQYNGIMQGDRVKVTGVCTAETGRYGAPVTIIAESDQPYCCGIWVYVVDTDLVAMRGECVEVVGIVQEYYDLTEIYVGSDETIRPQIVGSCPSMPNPIYVKTGEAEQEQWESCLLETHCVTVTTEPDEFGVFEFSDDQTPTGEMHGLFAQAWDPPAIGNFYCEMRGIYDYSWNEFRLRPRNQDDDLDTTPQSSCSHCGGAAPTPTPTSTPGPGQDAVVDLTLNKTQPNCFIEGDWFSLTVAAQNPNAASMSVDAYCALDVYGNYYFWDNWTTSMDKVPATIPASGTWTQTILEFTWPSGAGQAENLAFYFIMTDVDTFDLASNVEVVNFCFQ